MDGADLSSTNRGAERSCMLARRYAALAAAIVLLAATARGQQVLTAECDAPSVGRTLRYHVVLPAGYADSTQRYPVLYLLHGFSGNYTQWFRFGAAEAAKNRPLILVMPDGGNSWWINWAGSEEGQKNAWEDYLTKDLIAHVDATYRTIAERRGRALCGLSMGGYGALVVGLRHADLYGAIGSSSGALLFARQSAERIARGESLRPTTPPAAEPNPQVPTPGFSSQAERTPRGVPFTGPEDCAARDPFQLVLATPRDKLPHIYLDCGTDDPFLPATRSFLELLVKHDIPCTYSQSPGEHRGEYWRREVYPLIAVEMQVLERNLATGNGESPKQ
jgi:putative tributyrin esterase